MASRLYPGFGSGKGVFEGHFEVRSFGSAGRKDLEAGDKVILPTSAFKEISRLKLPFPLLFKVNNDRLKTANTVPSKDGKMPTSATAEQYAGLMEFSAPEGVALMPQWMMNNLKLREGGKVGFSTARGLPQASYVKLRPHQQAFVDLAAEIGPRDLLEAAMRNYSVLSAGERIVVDVADSIYNLDVLEVKPERAATLYGNLDLEVDFAPVKGSPDDVAYQAALAEEKAVLAEAAATKAAEAALSKAIKAAAAPTAAGKAGSKAGLPAVAGKAAAVGAKPASAEGGARPGKTAGPGAAVPGVAGTGLKRTASAAGGGIAAIRAMATAQATTAVPGSPTAAAAAAVGSPAGAGKGTVPAAPAAAAKGGARPGSAAKRIATEPPGAAAAKGGSPSSATAASRLAAAAAGPAGPAAPSAGSVAKAIAANVAAAIAQGGALGSKGGMSPARPGRGGPSGSPAGLLSPLPVGGGFGVYKGPLASASAFEAAVSREDAAVAVALDFDAPMVPVEALVHPFTALAPIAEEAPAGGPMVPSSATATGAAAGAHGLRTPPRAGAAAAATAGLPSTAATTVPGAFEGQGHRLGGPGSSSGSSPSGGKGGANTVTGTGTGTPSKGGGGASSPSKRDLALAQAQAAKQAKAEEEAKQKERERRAAAALARLSAPAPAATTTAVEPLAPAAGTAASVAASTPSKAAPGAPASPAMAPTGTATETAPSSSLAESMTSSLQSVPVNADGTRTCTLCRADIQPAAYDLHILRCRRNTAYHKTACTTCSALVLNKDLALHTHCGACGVLIPTELGGGGGVQASAIEPCIAAHAAVCPQRQVTCECGAKMAACALEGHRDSCPFALETCMYCRVKQKRMNIGAHQEKCGSRTATCDRCGKLVVLKNQAAHSAPGGQCDAIMDERRAKEEAAAAQARAKAEEEAARIEAEAAAKKREADGEGKEAEEEGEGKSSE